jgi:hypothetical protein
MGADGKYAVTIAGKTGTEKFKGFFIQARFKLITENETG